MKDLDVSGFYIPVRALVGDQPRKEGRTARENKALVPGTEWWGHRKAAHCYMYSAQFSSALVSRGGG